MVAVVVVVVLLGVAYWRQNRLVRHVQVAGSTPATAVSTTTSSIATVPSTTAPSTPPAPSGTGTTTPSSLPAPPVSVASANGGVTYSFASGSVLTLKATAPSWALVRTGNAQGPVVFAKNLQPDESENFLGPVWVRLGDPATVTLSGNGTPLSVPTSNGPVDVTILNGT